MNSPRRPVYLNLLEFHFPATAITSLLQRISGALLFLALPLLIYGLELSLQGGAERLEMVWQGRGARLCVALAGWAMWHHWLAGWRFLLIDIELGVARNRARATAWLVNLLSLLGLFLLLGMAL